MSTPRATPPTTQHPLPGRPPLPHPLGGLRISCESSDWGVVKHADAHGRPADAPEPPQEQLFTGTGSAAVQPPFSPVLNRKRKAKPLDIQDIKKAKGISLRVDTDVPLVASLGAPRHSQARTKFQTAVAYGNLCPTGGGVLDAEPPAMEVALELACSAIRNEMFDAEDPRMRLKYFVYGRHAWEGVEEEKAFSHYVGLERKVRNKFKRVKSEMLYFSSESACEEVVDLTKE